MTEIKWIKVSTDIFDDEKMKLIDSLADRDIIFYVWIRLLVQAGKVNDNGLIYLTKDIKFTVEMLSTIFNRTIASVSNALEILSRFNMIEIFDDNIIKIVNWEKHQNIEGMERVRELGKMRARRKRAKDKKNKIDLDNNDNVINSDSNVTVTEENKKENINKDIDIKNNNKELERDLDIKINDKDRDIEEKNNVYKVSSKEINDEAEKLLSEYENITGVKNVFSLSSLKIAIARHGLNYTRHAIEIAISNNKYEMKYINGILRNWKKDGYPKLIGSDNIGSISGKLAKTSTRELTEEERTTAEKELI